jgi:CheY-like chemotaxis protein
MNPLPNSTLRLLVVDDDPNTRALLGEALEISGANVKVSSSAQEARQTIASWHPDLMISDLGMPREDGYELIRRVRGLAPEEGGTTPAIACTGYTRNEDRARALDAGFDAVVTKPVNLDLLLATIAHVAGVREFGSAGGVNALPASDASAAAVARPRSAPDS